MQLTGHVEQMGVKMQECMRFFSRKTLGTRLLRRKEVGKIVGLYQDYVLVYST